MGRRRRLVEAETVDTDTVRLRSFVRRMDKFPQSVIPVVEPTVSLIPPKITNGQENIFFLSTGRVHRP